MLSRFLGARFQKSGAKPAFSGDISFWEQIRAQVQKRFNFSFVLDIKFGSKLRKMALLRGLCVACGITIEALPYNFESTDPFLADNVLAFHPLVRHAPPELHDISEMIGKAREMLQRPQTFAVGLEMLEHALQAVYHIMGPHTNHAATAHQMLANAYYQLGDAGLRERFFFFFFFCCLFDGGKQTKKKLKALRFNTWNVLF